MKKKFRAKRADSFSSVKKSVEITIAPNAGACFGVVRAIKLGEQAIARKKAGKGEPVFSLGPLIHNPMTVSRLEDAGMQTVQDSQSIPKGTAILRSHGVRREIEKELRERGVQIVDATCPLVKKPQRIAQTLGDKGYFLVLVGDSNHPEVKGVLSYFGRPDFLVTYDPGDVEKIPAGVRKIGVVAQTTIEVGVLDEVVRRCREKFEEVVLYNTICDATSIRQNEAEHLAKRAEVMVVVGGRNSSNTNKLVKICKKYQQATYLVEELDEIRAEWFEGKSRIGITGGASTPMEYVDSVGDHIAEMLST